MRRKVDELWDWAYVEGQMATVEPPWALHSQHPTAEDRAEVPVGAHKIARRPHQRPKTAHIVGLPFTRAFERFLDGERTFSPIRRALVALKPPKPARIPWEWRVAWAAVEAGYPTTAVAAEMMRCQVAGLETAVLDYFPSLQKLTEKLELEADHVRGDHITRQRTGCPRCDNLASVA